MRAIIFYLFFSVLVTILLLPKQLFAQSNCPPDPQNHSNQDLIDSCTLGQLAQLSNKRLMTFDSAILVQLPDERLEKFSNEDLITIGNATGNLVTFLNRFSNDKLVSFDLSILKQLPESRKKTFACEIQIQLGLSCGQTPQLNQTPIPTGEKPPPVQNPPTKITVTSISINGGPSFNPDLGLDSKLHLAVSDLNRETDVPIRINVIYSDGTNKDFYLTFHYKPKQTSEVTHLTSCQKITQSGNYVLDNDLSNTQDKGGDCFSIENISNVNFDCVDHTISRESPFYIKNAKNINLKSCNLIHDPVGIGSGIFFSEVENGTISSNSFQRQTLTVVKSNNIQITNNQLDTGAIHLQKTQNSEIGNNKFTAEHSVDVFIVSQGGSKNKIINNIMDGKSDGIFRNHRGVDDGIFLGSDADSSQIEKEDLVQNNTISNVYDCGIETAGLIQNTAISNNTIDNTGLCGIGGWWSNGWQGNMVSENIVNNSPSLLVFFYIFKNDAQPSQVFFTDNIFKNNKLTNQKVSSLETFYGVPWPVLIDYKNFITKLIAHNNTFTDNNLGLIESPYFDPTSMIVDGGGNICLQGKTSDFPLKCEGVQPSQTARIQSVSEQDINNRANQTIKLIESLTEGSNKQLPSIQPTPISTPEPIKLIDFNHDGVINVFDYIIFAQKKLGL